MFCKKSLLFLAGFLLAPAVASAAPVGVPGDWGLGLQPAASSIAEKAFSLHDGLLWVIGFICLFVLGLLIYVLVRFNAKANPVPSKTTHNVPLEIVWTIVPVLILLVIAFPSFKLLYFQDRLPEKTDLTLKVVGHQWYWSYEYPDQGNIAFDSRPLWDQPSTTDEQALKLAAESALNWQFKNEPVRMLEVDNRVVLPVGKKIKVQITAADVLHSWYIPALSVNKMAVTGRINEIWLDIKKEGVYYGQCSLICGTGHGYMPIVIEAVSPEQFDAWTKSKQAKVGANDVPPQPVFAAAD